MDAFDFRSWLREQRERRNWKKSEVAREAGLSQGYVGNLESGEREPTDDALRSLALAFGVEPDWLIAQVDTARIGAERMERLRKYAPEFLGMPAKRSKVRALGPAMESREAPPPRYQTPNVAAGDGIRTFEPDRIEHDDVDAPFQDD